ncbi:MAG: hypothetical protein WKF58_08645 [Ilumatobacteraceae bacterium]
MLGDEVAGVARHRVGGVVAQLGTGDDGQPLVEQRRQRSDDAGLRLTALTEEDHVVAGEDGVLELRQDGVVVAREAGDQRLAGGDASDGVAAQLRFDRHGGPSRFP